MFHLSIPIALLLLFLLVFIFTDIPERRPALIGCISNLVRAVGFLTIRRIEGLAGRLTRGVGGGVVPNPGPLCIGEIGTGLLTGSPPPPPIVRRPAPLGGTLPGLRIGGPPPAGLLSLVSTFGLLVPEGLA